MNDETTRRTFFSLAALSPLACLGLRKQEPKDEPHPHPIYGTWKKCAEEWEKSARLRDKDADYWEGRALRAEFDFEVMGADPLDENRMRQLRLEEQEQGTARTAIEIRDELQELRKGFGKGN